MYHKLGHNTDFNNASFIIDCYTYILFNLNPFILEQKIDDKNDRDFVETLWNQLVPNELYIYICRNDNFIELNKLTLKYQNLYKILNNFITEDNNNFLRLKECSKKNVLMFQYMSIRSFFQSIFVEWMKLLIQVIKIKKKICGFCIYNSDNNNSNKLLALSRNKQIKMKRSKLKLLMKKRSVIGSS